MSSQGIPISLTAIDHASSIIPADTPILMLNLLRFRPQASYPTGTDLAPATGRDAYLHHYIPAFQSIASTVSELIQPFWFGRPMAHLVGPKEVHPEHQGASEEDEKWDVGALMRYPNFQAFRDVTESERYEKEAKMYRLASLEDWRLICFFEMTAEQALA